jgi:homoserine dehydrogenase
MSSTPTHPHTSAESAPFAPTIVLKFGSSVLTHEQEVWSVVNEIQREVRRGRRVVAVVSALWGVTDRLIAEARRISPRPTGSSYARLVASGEHQSAALLSIALDQTGLEHTLLTARDVSLVALGPSDNAEPTAIHAPVIRRALDRAPVVVLPGFEAVDDQNQPVLLGRGGSDLTAVFVADALDADVRLVKDVDGVFEHDPGRAGTPPRRYHTIAWDLVPQVAGKLVQPKAVEFAQRRGLRIHVAAINSNAGTLITDRTQLGGYPTPHDSPAFGPVAIAV